MVQTLALQATQDGVLWPRRPLVSSKGLLSCVQNLPQSSHNANPARFRAVAFNSTGDLLAATDERGRVFVFFVTLNRYSLVMHLGVPTVSCVFSPSRRSELLVTCEDETARCIDVRAQTLICTLRGHKFPAKCASFQRSGQLALTASQDAVILWDTKDWSRFRVLNAGPGVEEAAFVARGDLVAVCFQDDTIMMWELETLALRYRFTLPEREPSPGLKKIAVSEDHQLLVASGRAPFIYVWEFESQTIIRIIELPPPVKEVLSHAFLPGQNTMISILGDDGGIFFLDVAAKNPQIKLEIANRGRSISAFDIECHTRYLAAATGDGFLLLYDMEIARETAARAQERRRKEGLVDLGEHARLRTRSGLPDVFSSDEVDPVADSNQVELNASEQSRPVPSKLIDNLFGVKHPRRVGGAPKRSGDTTTGQLDNSCTRPVNATRTRMLATTGPLRVPSQENDSPTLREKVQRRRISPLTRPPSQLTAQEIEVNRKRLVGSLKCNGMYPKKYRVLVWRFLLRLPKNEEAFRSLIAKGKHPVFVRLKDQYPLQDNRIFRRLHRILSAIVYWCPAFGEVSYLPAAVYPFVKIFRENDLAAFEASVSVMLHWCGDFLVSLPYPPVFAMSAIEKELARRDAQLFDHFTRYKVTSEAFAWSLLKSIFTEVLSEDEWMCLWDHLFTFSDTPQLLSVAVLAYLSYFRTALLAACDRFSIEQFFHQQNAIDIQKFLQLMMNLRENLDLSEFTALDDPAAASSSRDGHGPYWPLSRGQYPAFSHYPRFVVDFQISERNRIALEEAELSHKQKLFDQIEEESAKLKAEHETWMKTRKSVLEAEERRRQEAIAAEKERILHLKTLDYETRKRRLQHLSNMETSAHETLEEASKMLQTEYQRLESTLAMQKERMEFEISSRKQEEDLQRVESETYDRVHGIHKQREMEERLSRLRTEFETRSKQQELQDMLKFESWKREDEEQARKAKIQLRRREQHALLSQEKRVRQELEKQLLEQQITKDKELLELETARRARRKEQQGNDAVNHEFHGQKDDVSFTQDRTEEFQFREQEREDRVSPRHARKFTYCEAAPRTEVRKRSKANIDRQSQSDSDSENSSRRWNVPHDNAQVEDSDKNESPPRTPSKFASPQTPLQGPLSSNSSMSFASASMRRTMAEMSLLEKALGNISSSASSHSRHSSEGHARDGVDEDATSESISATHRGQSIQHAASYSGLDEVRHQGQSATRVSTPPQTPPRTPPQPISKSSGVQGDAMSTPRVLLEFSPVGDQDFSTPEFSHVADEDFSTPQAARQFSYAQKGGASPPQSTRELSDMQEEVMATPQPVRQFLQEDDEESSASQAAHEHFKTQHEGASTPRSARDFSQEEKEEILSTPQSARTSLPVAGEFSPQVPDPQSLEIARPTGGDVMEDSDSDSEEYTMDALQRPIADLEKKLGIRFEDFSDEEDEDEESFDARHESDEDETIEDDRAKLLQRAKRLLEMSSFDTDSDDDL